MRNASIWASVIMAGLLLGSAQASDIVVGQSAPLTGTLSSTGQAMALGVKICIDATNAEGGIGGRKIRHVLRDDGYKTEETVRLTRELIEKEHAVALIGYAGTGNVAEVLRQGVLSDNHVPLIAPLTGGEPLRKPFNPYIFHIRAGYTDEIARMVDQYANVGMTRFAVFYQNDPMGEAGVKGLEAALAKHKLSLVGKAGYEKGTDEVSGAVNTLAELDPQVVVMVAVIRPAAAFVREYRHRKPMSQIFSMSILNGTELHALAGDGIATGVGITQVVPSPYRPTIKMVRDYQEAMQKYAPDAKPSYTSFEEFIGAKVLVEALRRVKGDITGDSVRRALETINGNVDGFRVSFSPDSHIGSNYVDVTLLRNDGRLGD